MPNLTDLTQIRTLCNKYGFSLSKGFGQNFIVNPGVCPKICDVAGVEATSQVLEIGPGFGTLTQELAARAARVVSIELDERLLPVLQETLAGANNVKVVQGDALKLDLAALLAAEFTGPALLVANLPYYITSPLLMRLLEERLPLSRITVMVQREAAQRIVAQPGTREAGAISYAVHYYAKPTLEFTVSPGSFYPPPKVHSAVIALDVNPNPPLAHAPEREARLFKLVRAAFGQRRKTLANAASAGLGLPKQNIADALQSMELKPLIRPEQLTLEQFIQLEAMLWPQRTNISEETHES